MVDKLTGTVKYFLSGEGQKASLLAGGNGKQEQVLVGEFDAKFVDLFTVDSSGQLSLDVKQIEVQNYYGGNSHSFKTKYFDTPQTIDQLIDFEYNARPARVRNAAAKRSEWLNVKIDEFIKLASGYDSSYGEVSDNGDVSIAYKLSIPKTHDRYNDVLQAVRARSDRITKRNNQQAAEKAAKDAADLEQKQREATLEQKKADYIAEWVKEHGTENQQQRLAAGLLPRDEVLGELETKAFAPVVIGHEPYRKITSDDVRANCDDSCECNYGWGDDSCVIAFNAVDAQTATPAEWEKMQAIEELLPIGATIALREHTGSCKDNSCEDGAYTKKGIYVKIPVGPFLFNKEFEVGE